MGRGHKKAEDSDLVSLYRKLGSVWKVAEATGLCGQTVHERLTAIGEINRMNLFSEKDREYLASNYADFRNSGRLDDLAKRMGRTKHFLCRKARDLGLTDQKAQKPYAEKKGSNPYSKYHARVRSLRGSPHRCEVCGEDSTRKWYDWANLTGRYEDPSDYKRMCRDCHREYDKGKPILPHK
jgi:hypothetical protein